MQLKHTLLAGMLCLVGNIAGAATASPASVAAQLKSPAAASHPPAGPPSAPVDRHADSYDVGLMLGNQLQHSGLTDVAMEDLVRGLKDAAKGHVPSPAERDGAMQFSRLAREALAKKNAAAGHEFLKRNAQEEGIHVMPSGLQYRVLAAGDAKGAPPTLTDEVTIRYESSLADGTVYDRSDAHERPAIFKVNGVLKGWQEALLAMKPGAKWQIFVPPKLGYGASSPPMVPPGSVLVYQLELMHIEPAPPFNPAEARAPTPQPGTAPAH